MKTHLNPLSTNQRMNSLRCKHSDLLGGYNKAAHAVTQAQITHHTAYHTASEKNTIS